MECFDEKGDFKLSPQCLSTLVQTMAEGLYIVDRSGTLVFCNNALLAMTGYSWDELKGRSCQHFINGLCESFEQCLVFTNGSIGNRECEIKTKNNALIPVLINGRTLLDEQGAVWAAVETVTDISGLKKTRARLAMLEGAYPETFEKILGHSPVMRQVFSLIELAAASQATVLITGESGTGKELVARAIHQRSARANGPLVIVNCSALPENLLESELFGHVKGAYTGAYKDTIGRFELAHNGTLFLDEIGDVSPFIQVKLLRFLQEKRFERVGESQTRSTDVRIIAATNSDLRGLVEAGKFRQDLFFRLKVFPIQVPTLRQRKEDIGALVNHFIAQFNAQTGKQIQGLTHEAALTVMDYSWPGNVRELENAIEHAFVTCRDTMIGLFDLPLDIRKVELRKEPELSGRTARASTRQQRGSISQGQLEQLVLETGNNKTAMARALGVDRTTLWRNLKKFGLK